MSRPRTTSRAARGTVRAALVVGACAALMSATTAVATAATVAAPAAIAAPAAPGGPGDEVRLVLTDVAGARVGRGGPAATVGATVTNAGQVTAGGVQVGYQLPSGLTADAAASTPACTLDATVVRCTIGTLPPGASARVTIAVAERDPAAVLGDRAGVFLAPTSDQFDPGAGEVRRTTWFHEAGSEGSPLDLCWPITLPAPAMDVAGGTCDGTADAPARAPDEVAVTATFPPPFAASVVRSDQFDTEFTAPVSGDYVACAVQFDDGGYVAVTPAGTPFTPASVRVSVDAYGSATSAPFPLVGGNRYRLLARVSNRGPDGVDNGAAGGAFAGWDGVGIAPVGQGCALPDAAVLGSGPVAWRSVDLAGVTVAPSVDLGVAGAIVSAPVEGARLVSARIRNAGHDPDRAVLELALPVGVVPLDPAAPCSVRPIAPAPPTAPGATSTTSTVGPSITSATTTTTTPPSTTAPPSSTAPPSAAAAAEGGVRCAFVAEVGRDQVVSARVTADSASVTGLSWRVRGDTGVDGQPADDAVGLRTPAS